MKEEINECHKKEVEDNNYWVGNNAKHIMKYKDKFTNIENKKDHRCRYNTDRTIAQTYDAYPAS